MKKQYIVVQGNYDNATYRNDFIQAIGVYDDLRTACGVALLQLNDFAREGEMMTPLYNLDGDTGWGFELKHKIYTDYCHILLCEDGAFTEKENIE